MILLVAFSGGDAPVAADESIDAAVARSVARPVLDAATAPADAGAPDAGVAELAPPEKPAPSKRARTAKPPPAATGAPGKLRISVAPWAHVKIGGMERGEAPSTYTLLPGTYRIELSNDALGKRETITVEIEPGKTTRVDRRWQE
jgi:hypothetical protein